MTAGGEMRMARPHAQSDAASRQPRVCLFGASADTGNLGVSALMESTLAGLFRRLEQPDITVFDHRLGTHADTLELDGQTFAYRTRGARVGRRYWRSENLWNMRGSGQLGGFRNPGVRHVSRAAAVLDISGGDSFTDLYGRSRWHLIALPKLIALQRGIPLVLLPQTYGPFRAPRVRRVAERIVRAASRAWARDPDSFATLQELLGDAFDPARHRRGVDVAFLLEPRRPPDQLATRFEEWLAEDRTPVAGLGVSGLLYGDRSAAKQFGLAANYREATRRLARRLVTTSGARLALVPHVRGAGAESDDRGCADLLDHLGDTARERVFALPAGIDASETKWFIGQLDWFCGARMHSAIAALSSEVPTAAMAYSGKTRGVFATCGQEEWVADARTAGTAELLERAWRSWEQRAAIAQGSRHRVARVRAEATAQMDAIAAVCGDRTMDT